MNAISLVAFLPVEFLPLIIVAGALALILGARMLARTLLVLAAVMAFLPPFLEPLLMLLPGWALLLLVALVWLSVLGSVAALILGKGAADQMVGSLAADLVKWLFLLPIRLVRQFLYLLRP